jgi:hypothetical protein
MQKENFMNNNISCQNIHNNLPTEYLQENNLTFAQLYQSPQTLADHALKINNEKTIINLPLDCSLEAELFGAPIDGYNTNSTLKPLTITYTQQLPPFDINNKRLENILSALAIIKQQNKIPCLNISGFASVFDELYGSTLFYTEWIRNQEYIKKLFEYMANCYLQIINLEKSQPIQIISYAEPSLLLPMVGKKFAAEYANQIIFPFMKKIQQTDKPLIFHICALTTNIILQSNMFTIKRHYLSNTSTTDQILKKLTQTTKKPIFIGNNCINTNKETKFYDEIIIA